MFQHLWVVTRPFEASRKRSGTLETFAIGEKLLLLGHNQGGLTYIREADSFGRNHFTVECALFEASTVPVPEAPDL